MQIELVSLVSNLRYVASGRLQVAGYCFGHSDGEVDRRFGTLGKNPMLDCCEDHFFVLKSGVLTCGNQQGNTFLSRKGLRHFDSILKQVYNRLLKESEPAFQPRPCRVTGKILTWDEVKLVLEDGFKLIESDTRKRVSKLKRDIAELESKLERF